MLCWDQFTTCFENADRLFVCDVYAAGEDAIAEINSERLAKEIGARHPRGETVVQYLPGSLDRVACLRRELRAGDVLVAISGSGNSPNVINAVDWANSAGLTTITIDETVTNFLGIQDVLVSHVNHLLSIIPCMPRVEP